MIPWQRISVVQCACVGTVVVVVVMFISPAIAVVAVVLAAANICPHLKGKQKHQTGSDVQLYVSNQFCQVQWS